MENFLRASLAALDVESMGRFLLQFMRILDWLILYFEAAVGGYIIESAQECEIKLFVEYQSLIDQVAPRGFGRETAARISRIERYSGYTTAAATCLWKNGFRMDYVLLTLCQGMKIPYEEGKAIHTIQINGNWRLRWRPDLFEQLRFDIVSAGRMMALE